MGRKTERLADRLSPTGIAAVFKDLTDLQKAVVARIIREACQVAREDERKRVIGALTKGENTCL